MGRVVSLGSINVDHVRRASDAELASLAERYDWFPRQGQTVRVETLPDEFAPDTDEITHGGKGANQAVAAAAAGATTTMLGVVGTDHERFGVRPALTDAGVDADRVGVADAPTGAAYVFVDPSGDNRIVVNPGANAAVDDAYVDAHYDAVRDADCLLLQNEIPAEPVAALLDDLAAESTRPTVILDPAPPAGVDPLLGRDAVDYLTPNEGEYAALADALDAYDGVVVRKRGGDPLIVTAGDDRFTVDPPTVDPADTTGAGDVLNGYLAARLAAGASLRDAVETAVVAGSMATRTAGARAGIPTLDEVRAFRTE
ncbi:PfkB family carbohydrate kinase [Haloplanus rubicundus]|uniref:Sugar kinase n=1 Tax=Haloplanus rubicundus TaxID=1547898 RepID=A0A345EEJ7_9EURY|nr:PfkB family carbohydrate kinase [Haloplanus rubicundus]AXG10619.1 sugar kinase [Haloplanus rubicundus]